MSRSATDATRFTATSPHASSKITSHHPSSSSRSASFPAGRAAPPQSSGPPGETPREKVERLRAAARAAREAQNARPVDRVIDAGRAWADRFHRLTTWTLLGATGLAGIAVVWSITSLAVHTRTQKRAFIEREMLRLQMAQVAVADGTATEEQSHLVEQERASQELAQKRGEERRLRKENSLWKRSKSWLFGGLSMEDTAALRSPEQEAQKSKADVDGKIGVLEAVKEKVEESRRDGERTAEEVAGVKGGSLDLMAEHAVGALKTNAVDSKSWINGWIKGR